MDIAVGVDVSVHQRRMHVWVRGCAGQDLLDRHRSRCGGGPAEGARALGPGLRVGARLDTSCNYHASHYCHIASHHGVA